MTPFDDWPAIQQVLRELHAAPYSWDGNHDRPAIERALQDHVTARGLSARPVQLFESPKTLPPILKPIPWNREAPPAERLALLTRKAAFRPGYRLPLPGAENALEIALQTSELSVLPGHEAAHAIRRAFCHGLYAFWVEPDACVALLAPRVAVDGRRRPHRLTGPAVEWPEAAMFCIHGVEVPDWVVMHPERITADIIAAERDAARRSAMLQRYPGGGAAFVRDSHAEVLHEVSFATANAHLRGGRLWRSSVLMLELPDYFLPGVTNAAGTWLEVRPSSPVTTVEAAFDSLFSS